MELQQRVERLEQEVDILKEDIRKTLLDVQENVVGKQVNPMRWQNRAWVIAALNLLLALALFTNVRFYTSDMSSDVGAPLIHWMRAFWVTLAFLWLLLQMYPLALLLEQEEKHLREAAWHNAARLLVSNPGLTLALTSLILGVAVVSAFFPSLWILIVAALFVVVSVGAVRYLLQLSRQQSQAEERG